MKIQSRLGVTIPISDDCDCNCYASIIKQSSDAVLWTEGCDGFTIDWQLYDGSVFNTDQTSGTTYSLVGIADPLRVKLTNEDCCDKFSNVL